MSAFREFKYRLGLKGAFKMTTAQRIQLREAARILLIFLLLWLALFQMAHARAQGLPQLVTSGDELFDPADFNEDRVLDQPLHIKVLLSEGWEGRYIISHYNEITDNVRIDFCGRLRECTLIADGISTQEFETYEPVLIDKLRTYRNRRADELDEGFLAGLRGFDHEKILTAVTGGSQNSEDLQVLDQIIQNIEADGITRWVQLTEECLKEMPLEVASTKTSIQLAEVLTEVFRTPVNTEDAAAE